MKTNYSIYRKEINNNNDYRITMKDFLSFLTETDSKKAFEKEMAELKKEIINIYDIAVDWSIPVIMVKALR